MVAASWSPSSHPHTQRKCKMKQLMEISRLEFCASADCDSDPECFQFANAKKHAPSYHRAADRNGYPHWPV